MDGSMYQKILETYKNMDSAKRGQLLRIYLHIPSLPKLRAIRSYLAELKAASRRRNGLRERLSRKR